MKAVLWNGARCYPTGGSGDVPQNATCGGRKQTALYHDSYQEAQEVQNSMNCFFISRIYEEKNSRFHDDGWPKPYPIEAGWNQRKTQNEGIRAVPQYLDIKFRPGVACSSALRTQTLSDIRSNPPWVWC